MIKNLSIKNIGGIREAEITFKPGFNVITGESGAGKSSIIRSIELLTGIRGGTKFIRAGEKIGKVEGVFEETKLFREVSENGRTKAKINGENIALTSFSEIVNGLVRIQSQFSQLELLEPERQLAMLDSCLPEKIRKKTFDDFHEIYNKARESVKNLRAIKKRRSEIEKQYSNAREIFDLIKISKPESGLEKQLENQLADLTHKKFQRERAKKNLDELTGGLSEDGLISKTENYFEELYEFSDDNEINAIKNSIEILYNAVKNIAENISSDDEENETSLLEEIETRLGALRRLKRLCNITDENELLNYSDEAYKNLEWLEKSYKELEELSSHSLEQKRKANALAMEIRQARYEAAKILEERVNILLHELGMSEINFAVNFTGLQKLNYNGADEIEFILKEGSRIGRVDKIASGGELSRLLLALQLSLPDEWLPPTIVFDEVEAGLGGRAAVLSGLQLKKLSTRCQVILVTHEASIAALGTNHILIQRQNGETIINNIDNTERIREIARMLSGSPDMAEAREHAKILLNI